MRRPVIAGNWKMYKTIAEAVEFIAALKPKVASASHCEVVVAPPFTALHAVASVAAGSNIRVAGQDVAWEREGAFTGDISAPMLAEAGCSHAIIGHSERRQIHGETDESVSRKIGAVLAAGLTPIVCVGETLEQREAGRTDQVLQRQVEGGFAGLTAQDFFRIIVAYEPVWAIGTGRTATPETAAESHRHLRSLIAEKMGARVAGETRILYGGSVKPDNIKALMAREEIDGVLVGGASLKVDSFAAIVAYPL
ncbi:MAG: triose-phosphate isomerase [Terriglobia bacterium]